MQFASDQQARALGTSQTLVETDLPWRDVAIAREPLLARALQEYRNGARSYSTADEMAAIQERNSDHQLTEP